MSASTSRLEPALFGPEDVIAIALKLEADDDMFVIGGQATNLWAWFYQDRDSALKLAGPFTSQDIDYFGSQSVAKNVADVLGGKLLLPDQDNHSPNTAIVEATIEGKPLRIDFMHTMLGIKTWEVQRGVSELALPGKIGDKDVLVAIRLLHPLLCLKSRVINMLHPATRRRDRIAQNQLRASMAVVRIYIDDAITEEPREANQCFRTLYSYLRSNEHLKRADIELNVDPLELLKHFENDKRLHKNYRRHQLHKFISTIELRRSKRLTA